MMMTPEKRLEKRTKISNEKKKIPPETNLKRNHTFFPSFPFFSLHFFPLAAISSLAASLGTGAWCEYSIVNSPFPCVIDRSAVE